MTEDKVASPHACLQSVLAQLGRLNPHLRIGPMFADRNTAEHIIAITATTSEQEVALTPVWDIDHGDLLASEIVAWTVTTSTN